jgi:hypothetical protein
MQWMIVLASVAVCAQPIDKRVSLTVGDDVRCFFAVPGQAQRIVLKSVSVPDGKELRYEVRDYTGQLTGQGGTARVEAKMVTIEETFPLGYYEICFPDWKLVFGVASVPPYAGTVDPYYAIEGLISSRRHQEQLVELMVRGGIHFNREWCNYPALEPERGTIKTTRDAFYTMAGPLGLTSIFCFADFPEWYYEGVGKVGRRPPIRRLLGLDESIQTLLARRGPGLLAFHVLNEYDSYKIPGEAYMPTIKVAGYAMRDSELPLVAAPFCRGVTPSLKSSIENGLLDFVDVFAFHSYSDPKTMVSLIKGYREAMAKHAKGAMPIWVTESGKPWSRALDPAQIKTTHGGPLGALHPPPDQDMISAMWITMRTVEAKAAGIEKHFAFTLPFFQENNNNFGMLDYHYSPLRSLFAYMQNVRELAGKEYVGDWRAKPENVKILRVFGDVAGNRTAVVYTGEIEATSVSLSGVPYGSVRSIDGKELTVDGEGRATITGGLAYVTLAADRVKPDALDTETEAMALLKQAKSYRPSKRVNSSVVYQFNHWLYEKWDGQTYYDESNVFSLNVFNLGTEAATLSPRLVLPEGMTIAGAPSAADLAIGPRSERQLTWKLDKSASSVASYRVRLVDDNHPHGGVTVPFLNRSGLRTETFEFMDPKRWRQNSSGTSTFTFDEAEKAVKISTAFDFGYGRQKNGGLNYWVFPEYVLDLPKESLQGVVAMSLELKLKQDNGLTKVAAPLAMFVYQDVNEKGKYDSITYGTPTEEWQEFTIAIDPEKAPRYRMIRIGMCPTASHVDYWIRNVRLYVGR